MRVSINGKSTDVWGKPGTYYTIERRWNRGDIIEISMPMDVYTEHMPDNADRIAFLYGPLVLSGDLGTRKPAQEDIPVFISDNKRSASFIERVSNTSSLVFRTVATNNSTEISLIPFYELHHQHYIVYWDKFTTEGWKSKKKIYEDELKRVNDVKAHTLDEVRVGEMQPERDHNFKGEKTNSGEALGRKWRDASDGGWFSFDLNTNDSTALKLVCTYWGSDSGNRNFEIFLDDINIATQKLESEKPNEFFEVNYNIPANALKGKQHVTIKFQALPGSMAGGLFGCRLLRR